MAGARCDPLAAAAMTHPQCAEPVLLHAAGSLRRP